MSLSAGSQVSSTSILSSTNNPNRLLRLFAGLSVLSIAAILLLAGSGIYRVFSGEMIRVAELWAVHVADTIFDQDREVFLKAMNEGVVRDDFEKLDASMKKFLISFDMYKIKAFSANKTIIYSTDHSLIGKVEGENHKLDAVLSAGTIISELEHKEKIRDLKGDVRLGVDVVESYVPVYADGQIVGSFEVYVEITSTQARIISATEGATLVLALVLILVFGLLYLPMRKGTLGLKKAQEQLAELASVDGLTGAFNRRYLLNRIHEERDRMVRAKAETTPGKMSFVMVDIDFFKKVNDNYGHQSGDAVLQEVSFRLRDGIRNFDVLGRYGGEEFLVLLPNTALDEALLVANRLLQAVCRTPVTCGDVSLTVTVSIGVADTLTPDEDYDHAISRADRALYRAKETGRNRVCFASQPEALDETKKATHKTKLRLT